MFTSSGYWLFFSSWSDWQWRTGEDLSVSSSQPVRPLPGFAPGLVLCLGALRQLSLTACPSVALRPRPRALVVLGVVALAVGTGAGSSAGAPTSFGSLPNRVAMAARRVP